MPGRKKFKSSAITTGHSRWYYLIRGIVTSFALTIPVFLILSAAIAFTSFPEELMSPAVLITIVVSIIVASFFATAGAKNSGWFNGTLVGLIYMSAATGLRWILEQRCYINADILTMLLAGILLGSLSGMAALNLGRKRR